MSISQHKQYGLSMYHRCVLAFRSPVFRAELFGPMKEKAENLIRIDDMEPAILEALLHFIYTDRLPDSCSDGRNPAITHLLVAVDRYGVERLRLLCESKLSEAIDVETVATTLALAERSTTARSYDEPALGSWPRRTCLAQSWKPMDSIISLQAFHW